MRIVLDATPVGVRTDDKGGVYRYIDQLISSIAELDTPHRFRLLFNFCRSTHIAAFEAARHRYAALGFEIVRSRIPSAIWMRGWAPAELAAGANDIFHGLYDFIPPVLSGHGVLTIHDLRYLSIDGTASPEIMRFVQESPRLLADYQKRIDFFKRQRSIIRSVARRASLIITPSEFSKVSIVESLGIAHQRVKVVHHGIDPSLTRTVPREEIEAVHERHGIDQDYLLFVGKMDPLKNVETLLRAFAIVRDQAGVQLVLAGPTGWNGEVLREMAETLGLASSVRFLGHVPDYDLAALYQGAEIMVFPSLFEGFGLPVVEAMACGTPVVCSAHCSLPEVAGGAARLVDPSSAEEIASEVLAVLGDRSLHDSLRQAGFRRAGEFSWLETARNTLSVYEQAAGN